MSPRQMLHQNGCRLFGTKVVVIITFTLAIGESICDTVVPPVLTTYPGPEVTFLRHDDITLPCEGAGYPEPSYYWTRDGYRLDINVTARYSQSDDRLTIRSASADDVGVYHCWVWNTGGKDRSPPVNVTMIFLQPFPTDAGPTSHLVVTWASITLPCDCPDSNPPVTVTWLRDGHVVVSGDLIVLDLTGNLHITSFEENLAGVYTCTCHNIAMRAMVTSPPVRLIADKNPGKPRPVSLMWKNSQMTVTPGSTLTIQCIFAASPPPEISWQRMKGVLPSGRYDVIHGGSTLVIRNVTWSDADGYECVAFNELSLHPINEQIRVLVEDAVPEFKTIPRSTNVTVGQNVSLTCVAKAVPKPIMEWYANWKKIEYVSESNMHIIDGEHGSGDHIAKQELHVTNVSIQDTLVITCVAYGTYDSVSTSSYIRVFGNAETTHAVASAGNRPTDNNVYHSSVQHLCLLITALRVMCEL